MNSKEAFEEIIEVCNYYHRQKSYADCETICGYPIKKIERDLEVLEILKKSIFFHETHEHALDLKHKGLKFMNIAGNVWGEDATKVKEWLENENQDN